MNEKISHTPQQQRIIDILETKFPVFSFASSIQQMNFENVQIVAARRNDFFGETMRGGNDMLYPMMMCYYYSKHNTDVDIVDIEAIMKWFYERHPVQG